MKKILFLVHDPGGYDAVEPVYKLATASSIACKFYCTGPSALMNEQFKICTDNFLAYLNLLVQQGEVSALVTGTSWGAHIELEAIQICRDNRVPTVSVLDYWANYRSRFNFSNTFIFPDYLIVMDNLAKREAIEDGVPPEIINVLGHPGLDRFVALGRNMSHNLHISEKAKILFLSQPISGFYGYNMGFTEYEALSDCIRAVQENHKYELAVKFHPKDNENFKLHFSNYSVEGQLYDLVERYNLIVGMSTMGLLHANLMGKPIISYQPGLIPIDDCITNKLSLSKGLYSYNELAEWLAQYDQESVAMDPLTALKDYIWHDGKSTPRVLTFLKEVANIEN